MVFRFLSKVIKCSLIVLIFFFVLYQIVQKLRFKNADLYSWEYFSKEEIQETLKTTNLENARRASHIDRICEKYNLGRYKDPSKPVIFKEPPAPQYEVFFYDLEHKLSLCPIYKAGSSTWLYNLALLGGFTEEDISKSKLPISEILRKIFPVLESSDAEKALDDSLTLIFVRHPFERILSAYRDKLENVAVRGIDGTQHFYRSFGSKIVEKYRPGGNNTNIRTILKPDQYIWNEEKEPLGIEPSFKEFVRHLIDTDLRTRADDHWIPYYLFCTPCHVKYDVVGKVETMLQDQIYVILLANLRDKIKPRWRHKTNPFSSNADQDRVSDIARVYFSQLNKTEVLKLYKKYQLDFYLFEYTAEEYYKYATNR